MAPEIPRTPEIRAYLSTLEASLHLVSEPHKEAAKQLGDWILREISRGEEANVIVICTGNSRRSVFGSVTGNVAASYHNLRRLHFYSGGTAPSAIDARTARALEDIGLGVQATGREARRGDPKTQNPIYNVRWGSGETLEFSKVYNDSHNPQRGFAALLVCTEADDACPVVIGASARISCPFTDPKAADGTNEEATRYAEKRDEIGRFMLSVTQRVATSLKR